MGVRASVWKQECGFGVQTGRIAAGVEHRAMMFLVRVELVPFGIETIGLLHQQVGIFHIAAVLLIERLIAKE